MKSIRQKKAELGASPKGRVLLDLWARGQRSLTTIEIKRATGDWSAEDLDRFSGLLPVWLRSALERSHVPRKSARIGLSGAYDWSNPEIRDEVLIAKVLEKFRFEDVARLCFHYGLPRVRRVFREREYDPIAHACLTRMLSNIDKGLRMR